MRADLDILYYLAHLLEAVFEETSLYNPVDVVREFDQVVFTDEVGNPPVRFRRKTKKPPLKRQRR